MTVCGKSAETQSMNSQNRNLVANRPSFMITDILSTPSNDKIPCNPAQTEYLEHLKRFSAMSDNRFALDHGFRMMMPPQLDAKQQKDSFCDSDDDDFHGSDDADVRSSDGSNSEY